MKDSYDVRRSAKERRRSRRQFEQQERDEREYRQPKVNRRVQQDDEDTWNELQEWKTGQYDAY